MQRSYNPRLQRLREGGHKLTNARMTILSAIESGGGHMTPHEILDAVTALDPSIGRASVYRALDLFTRLSIIRPTYVHDSTPIYVLLPNGHHHHIICTDCSKVIEFEDCGLEKLEHDLETRLHVKLTGHLLEFFGLCESCAAHAEEQ